MYSSKTEHNHNELHKNISDLKSGYNLYKRLLDASKNAFITTDMKKNIVDVNKAAQTLLQCPKDRLIGINLKSFLEMVPEQILQYQDEQLYLDHQFKDEWLLLLEDGSVKHVEFLALLMEDHIVYKIFDITVQKQVERERNISSHMFKDVFQKAVDGIVIYDQTGAIVDANPAFIHIVNLSKEELLKKYIHDFVDNSSIEEWQKEWMNLIETGTSEGSVVFNIAENQLFLDFTTSSNVYNGHFMSIFRDVTEKRLIEQKLNKSEELFSVLFEKAIDGIVITDQKGMILNVNKAACKIFESDKKSLIGSNITQYVMKKDRRFYKMNLTFKEKGEIRDELFFLMPNGQKKLLEFTSKALQKDHLTLTIYRNVSERWQMEMKLRKSENKFRKIFEGSMDGLILWKDNCIHNINKAGAKILEIDKEKILSMELSQMLKLVPENKKEIDKYIYKLKNSQSLNAVIPIIFKDGKTKHIEFSTKMNLVSGMNLTVFKDVTEKLEMQEQLRKSDTLNVVGELAAGIAHEIRNPMTALKGFIQLLQGSVKEDFSTYFSVINSELKRIESIITEFLILAKPQATQFLEKDINLIVQETIELLRAQALLQNVIITPIYHKQMVIFCEANQLKQVFINIMKNALEAMPTGGKICIETDTWKDEYVKISISDEGMGIPEEKIKKLGEPFYTTKERGTGLGLMVSYKIIEEHHGWIEVESSLGEGTTFHVYLPFKPDSL
ncbi:PAS domain S-box protein [Peribacillus tepidiphilus]|uniref:PAS domain S-box protein n=1 Tax=Peribacillus tepidiphilus TaxID=2652445 RepID=UPI0035B53101